MEGFGETLRRLREQAAMSQPQLAARVHWSQSRISRAEHDKAIPPPDVTVRLDAILNGNGELINLQREAEAERAARNRDRRMARDADTADPDEVSESQRRHVLALAASVAFGASLPESPAEIIAAADVREAPARVRAGDVARVERAIHDLEEHDHQAGGVPVRHLALGELRWATALLGGSCQPGVRQRLQVAVAYLSDLAAWTTADAGRYPAARKLFLLGLRAAHDADDGGILAHVASGFARMEIQARNPKSALELVRLASTATDRLPPPALSMLHIVKGLALAKIPDTNGCLHHLGQAEQSFRPPALDDPAWIGYFTAAKLAGDTSNALYDLAQSTGRRNPALLTRLTEAVDNLPDSRARSKAIAAARLATTLYLTHETQHADTVAANALRLAAEVRSARLVDELTDLCNSARYHATDPTAQAVARDVRQLTGPTV